MGLKKRFFLAFFSFLVLIASSCSSPELKIQEEKLNASPDVNTNRSIEILLSGISSFSEYVLKENLRFHEFTFPGSDSLKHFMFFSKSGLTRITAYSDKRYPIAIKPTNYEHFTVFIFEYSTETKAKYAINKLRKVSLTLSKTKSENLWDSVDAFTKDFHFSSKSGGLICQKDKYVFSLVETCRETPLRGTWLEYEDIFMSFVLSENETTEILM